MWVGHTTPPLSFFKFLLSHQQAKYGGRWHKATSSGQRAMGFTASTCTGLPGQYTRVQKGSIPKSVSLISVFSAVSTRAWEVLLGRVTQHPPSHLPAPHHDQRVKPIPLGSCHIPSKSAASMTVCPPTLHLLILLPFQEPQPPITNCSGICHFDLVLFTHNP